MNAGEVAGIVTAAALFLGALVAFKKYRPERNDITITSADKVNAMTLRFAGAVDRDNEGLREDIDELKAAFAQYRVDTDARMAELVAELRGERAEKQQLAAQNTALVARVDELEAEVARLKANRP